MANSDGNSVTDHRIGHWVLTVLAVVILVGHFAFLAWFGAERTDLAFVVWGFCTVPLMVAAYSRTRMRVLLLAAILLLLLVIVMASVTPVYWRFGTQRQFHIMVAVLVVLPCLWTIAWLARFHQVSLRPTRMPKAQFARSVVLMVLLALGGGYWWAWNQHQEPIEDPRAAVEYAGCYDIHVGRWIPSSMAGHSAQGIVPTRIQLDTTRGSLPDSTGRASFHRGAEIGERLVRPGWFGAAYWLPLEGDEVLLVWSTGLHGVSMRLRPKRHYLGGMAVGHTDVSDVWPEPRARVRAIPSSCDDLEPDTLRPASRPAT